MAPAVLRGRAVLLTEGVLPETGVLLVEVALAVLPGTLTVLVRTHLGTAVQIGTAVVLVGATTTGVLVTAGGITTHGTTVGHPGGGGYFTDMETS